MAFTNRLRKLLHRKAWESCTSSPVATAAGAFVVSDKHNIVTGAKAFLVAGVSSIYLYEGNEDAWRQCPNSGIAGTFAAGSCGEFRGLGAMGGVFTQTATAGTTTTITTNRTILRGMNGSSVRVVAGTGVGYEGTVASNTLGANAVVTVTPASGVAFDATTQYQIYSGSLWFFNAGTAAVGFGVFDYATNAWTARSVTGLPTAWGTDAQLVSTIGSSGAFATGTATSGSATTLVNSAKSWGANMWANYQVRITAGTGKGQIRTITSNNGTTLTVPTWTVNPDSTSVYSIEGNDDVFYLLGNNAVTMYKFNVSSNTWATLSPVAARAGVFAAGGTADWVDGVDGWDNETLVNHYSGTVYKQNGRYIYSMRGGATATLDLYDIAANTWISNVLYAGQMETFTTGSSSVDINGSIFITKEATGRVFQFDVDLNYLRPIATNTTQVALGGTAVAGDKMFVLPYTESGTTILFGYMLRHSGTELVRIAVI